MERTRSESSTRARAPQVIQAFDRLKAGEPARTDRLNYDHFADAMTGSLVPRHDSELMAEAHKQVDAQREYAKSPEGRYVGAMTAAWQLSDEVSLAAQAGLQAASRSWPGEQRLAAALGLDVGQTAARLVRAAAIAQVASAPGGHNVPPSWAAEIASSQQPAASSQQPVRFRVGYRVKSISVSPAFALAALALCTAIGIVLPLGNWPWGG